MNQLAQCIDEFCKAADHPGQTVQQTMERTGKKAIGCFPLYTPDELVDAAGFLPVGLWGGPEASVAGEKYLQSFCCSVMKANLSQAMDGTYHMLEAVLIPAFCDTLKCVCENWKAAVPQIPAIPLVYPQNIKSPSAKEYLEGEFLRIKEKLEQLAGRPISETELTDSWSRFEACRAEMREFTVLAAKHPERIKVKDRHKILKAYYFMDKDEYCNKLTCINRELKNVEQNSGSEWIRVVATGLMLEPDALLSALERNRICIAADDLAQESRSFRIPGSEEGSVLQKMARRFLAQRGDPILCEPKKSRGRQLIELVKQTKAEAVLIAMMKFCEPEEFDFPVYKKELEREGIPYLYLELEQNMKSAESIETRLEGFVEVMRQRRILQKGGQEG